jgi:hypothetical protein
VAIPFKESLRGAPLVNSILKVVGMVVGGSGDEVVAIPSRYIMAAMKAVER